MIFEIKYPMIHQLVKVQPDTTVIAKVIEN